jgi:hypothetical protein
MRRVAIYARETTGRVGRARLDRQVGQLAAQVARQPDWNHVATYADQWTSVRGERSGLGHLLANAPACFDVVIVDGYGRLSPNRHDPATILDHLTAAGITGYRGVGATPWPISQDQRDHEARQERQLRAEGRRLRERGQLRGMALSRVQGELCGCAAHFPALCPVR